MLTIELKNKVIPFNFGLNELIILRDYTNKDVGAAQALYILCQKYLDISLIEIEHYLAENPEVKNEIEHQLKNITLPTDEKIEELYCKAVGEIGINPLAFWTMTEKEIEIAYEGYIHRKELDANLMVLAFSNTLTKNTEMIRLIKEKGYTVGSINEREKTFSILNIEE